MSHLYEQEWSDSDDETKVQDNGLSALFSTVKSKPRSYDEFGSDEYNDAYDITGVYIPPKVNQSYIEQPQSNLGDYVVGDKTAKKGILSAPDDMGELCEEMEEYYADKDKAAFKTPSLHTPYQAPYHGTTYYSNNYNAPVSQEDSSDEIKEKLKKLVTGKVKDVSIKKYSFPIDYDQIHITGVQYPIERVTFSDLVNIEGYEEFHKNNTLTQTASIYFRLNGKEPNVTLYPKGIDMLAIIKDDDVPLDVIEGYWEKTWYAGEYWGRVDEFKNKNKLYMTLDDHSIYNLLLKLEGVEARHCMALEICFEFKLSIVEKDREVVRALLADLEQKGVKGIYAYDATPLDTMKKMYAEKKHMYDMECTLNKLDEMVQRGIKLSRNYDYTSDLSDMKSEIKFQMNLAENKHIVSKMTDTIGEDSDNVTFSDEDKQKLQLIDVDTREKYLVRDESNKKYHIMKTNNINDIIKTFMFNSEVPMIYHFIGNSSVWKNLKLIGIKEYKLTDMPDNLMNSSAVFDENNNVLIPLSSFIIEKYIIVEFDDIKLHICYVRDSATNNPFDNMMVYFDQRTNLWENVINKKFVEIANSYLTWHAKYNETKVNHFIGENINPLAAHLNIHIISFTDIEEKKMNTLKYIKPDLNPVDTTMTMESFIDLLGQTCIDSDKIQYLMKHYVSVTT